MSTQHSITSKLSLSWLIKRISSPAFLIFAVVCALSYIIGANVAPQVTVQKVSLDVYTNSSGQLSYTYKGKPVILTNIIAIKNSQLSQENVVYSKDLVKEAFNWNEQYNRKDA